MIKFKIIESLAGGVIEQLWSGEDNLVGWQARILIACRADGPLSHSLDGLSSEWDRPIE